MEYQSALRITQTAATIAELMGFSMPPQADTANEIVLETARQQWGGAKAERALLYNPDAIALWLYQKYTALFQPVIAHSQMALPIHSVMPSVTPVCFASMYTGLTPDKHGIQAYVKPVLQVTTLFDAAIAAGKKPIIISTKGDSISKIFLEREMDYIICKTPDECNENAKRILEEDKHDLICVYNGNYDSHMHRWGPESENALSQLQHNAESFVTLSQIAKKVWAGKNGVAAFLPDHGCHEIDGFLGSHGLDMYEDMNVIHFYQFYPKG